MFSVIIPLYNKENNIRETINSVIEQTYSGFEIVVVDDGSTDNSFEIVNGITDPRIRLITQKNQGVSKTRNRGVVEAKYNFIALLDGDDQWSPTFLEEMKALIEICPEASLFGCTWAWVHPDGRVAISDYNIPQNFRGYVDNYFVTGVHNTLFNSSSVVFKKNAFIEIGMFDEGLTIGEDIDLWFRFALKKKLAFVNKCMSYYLLGAENRASKNKKNREECLIWNLDRFEKDEIRNPEFKSFLDSWRFAHIINFFKGDRSEINEITSLLKKIDLKRYPLFWTAMRYLPKPLQIFFFSFRQKYQQLLKHFRE
jgi:glycosyltransferase involved in cell wall biosynthesis